MLLILLAKYSVPVPTRHTSEIQSGTSTDVKVSLLLLSVKLRASFMRELERLQSGLNQKRGDEKSVCYMHSLHNTFAVHSLPGISWGLNPELYMMVKSACCYWPYVAGKSGGCSSIQWQLGKNSLKRKRGARHKACYIY